MKIDVAHTIGSVTREVSAREVNGAPARVIAATRSYDTSVQDVWDALTNIERLSRWFLPISGDLRLGGRYQLEGNAEGEIYRCEPLRALEVTWEMHGEVSWLSVQLSQDPDGGTRLRLEHVAHVPDEMWGQLGPGVVGIGWDQALLGLDRHLSTGATVDPQEAVAWLSTEEGRAFVHQSSDAWCAASVAAGTEPASARAGADRVAAMYTGDEAPLEMET